MKILEIYGVDSKMEITTTEKPHTIIVACDDNTEDGACLPIDPDKFINWLTEHSKHWIVIALNSEESEAYFEQEGADGNLEKIKVINWSDLFDELNFEYCKRIIKEYLEKFILEG